MQFGRPVEGIVLLRVLQALRFLRLLGGGLGELHIPRGGLQDLSRVVAERELVEMLTRSDTPGEDFPLGHNRLDVREDEVRETHKLVLSNSGRRTTFHSTAEARHCRPYRVFTQAPIWPKT